VLATGCRWRKDGIGRAHRTPIPGSGNGGVYTPDDVMAGVAIEGPVLVYDDDHFYMGGVIAEKLRRDGLDVTLATTAPDVSHWTHNTMEQNRIQALLLELGVDIAAAHDLLFIGDGEAELACVYTGRRERRACTSAVMVTSRLPEDALYHELTGAHDALSKAGIKSVDRVGDCLAPGTIAHAIYAAHRHARELDEAQTEGVPFKRELVALA
jgi:dimethylamine/trimethylamine dehydrogenase